MNDCHDCRATRRFASAFPVLPLMLCLLSASAGVGHEEIPPYVAADPRVGESLNVSLVGSLQVEAPWDPAGGGYFSTTDLFIAGDWGYMGSNSGLLHVIDISHPDDMRLVTQVQMPGPALDVKVQGDLAVVAVQNGDINELGMVVVDVSDPAQAHILSILQDPFWSGVHNLFLAGDRAYLAHSASRGLTVVDLSDPLRPVISGTWLNEISGAASIIHDVFIGGGLAFLSDLPRGTGGLVILDLADPDRPRTLSSLPIEEGLHNCFRSGRFVYCNQELGGWQRGLHIVDIADPQHPVEVATATMKRASVGGGIGPHNTWIKEDLLYWAFYDSGFRILDIQDATRPVEIGYYRTPYAWSAQPHDDGLIYVADARLSSLRAFRFDRPGFIVRDGNLERSILSAGTQQQIRVEALVEPRTGSTRSLRQVTARLLPDRDLSWLLGDDGGGRYSGLLTLPSDLRSGEYHVEIRAEDDAGAVYPFSELSLQLVPERDFTLLDEDITLAGTTFHVEGGALAPGFLATGPVLKGDRSLAVQVKPAGQDWHAELRFADHLDFLGYSALRFSLHPGDARGQNLTLQLGELDVRLVGRRGNRRIDLTSPTWQTVVVPLDVFFRERGITEMGFTGDLTGTFYVDDMQLVSQQQMPTLVAGTGSVPETLLLQPNYPNPFNAQTLIPFRVPATTRVELRILDLLGQTVAILVERDFAAGAHVVPWDGTGATGKPLATGVYLYQLRAGDRQTTRRLLLLR